MTYFAKPEKGRYFKVNGQLNLKIQAKTLSKSSFLILVSLGLLQFSPALIGVTFVKISEMKIAGLAARYIKKSG